VLAGSCSYHLASSGFWFRKEGKAREPQQERRLLLPFCCDFW
jgi:hypothetical protein